MTRARTAAALWLAFGMALVVAACAPSVPGSIPTDPSAPTEPGVPAEPPGGSETTCVSDPLCLPTGEVCQSSAQCCRGACTLDGGGILRCFTCKPSGTACSGAGDPTCCYGTSCVAADAGGYACAPTPPQPICGWEGAKCSNGAECCSGECKKHRCAPCGPYVVCEPFEMCTTAGNVCQFNEQCCGDVSCLPADDGYLRCSSCLAGGASCSDSAQCCSRWCEGGACGAPPVCADVAQVCTASVDCCAGLVCALPPGETAGACVPPCIWNGGPCTADGECCSGSCAIPAGETMGICGCAAP